MPVPMVSFRVGVSLTEFIVCCQHRENSVVQVFELSLLLAVGLWRRSHRGGRIPLTLDHDLTEILEQLQ